jgi:hypothetical protein
MLSPFCPSSSKAEQKDLADDYFYFFDNVAFSDHEDWNWCYCAFYSKDFRKCQGKGFTKDSR